MAVRIRLKRTGRRNRPCYRIGVFDSRKKRDGKTIEDVGFYDPIAKDEAQHVRLDHERIEYWLSVGAKPTETVASILKRHGVGTAGGSPAPGSTAAESAPAAESGSADPTS